MKIKITDEGKNYTLLLPTRLILNQLSATLLPVLIKRKSGEAKLSGSFCRKFAKSFYKTRRKLGGKIELLEAETHDGTYIKIIL